MFLVCSLFSVVSAMSILYVPAEKIYMTGSNINTRFDVKEVIFEQSPVLNEAPYFQKSDMTLRGSFYMKDI